MPASSGMSAALLPVRRGLGPSSAGTWDLSFKMALKAAPRWKDSPSVSCFQEWDTVAARRGKKILTKRTHTLTLTRKYKNLLEQIKRGCGVQ